MVILQVEGVKSELDTLGGENKSSVKGFQENTKTLIEI